MSSIINDFIERNVGTGHSWDKFPDSMVLTCLQCLLEVTRETMKQFPLLTVDPCPAAKPEPMVTVRRSAHPGPK